MKKKLKVTMLLYKKHASTTFACELYTEKRIYKKKDSIAFILIQTHFNKIYNTIFSIPTKSIPILEELTRFAPAWAQNMERIPVPHPTSTTT